MFVVNLLPKGFAQPLPCFNLQLTREFWPKVQLKEPSHGKVLDLPL